VTERSAARVNLSPPLSGTDPGKGVEHHIEPEFEPVGEVLFGVTPDQQRNATRQLSMTSRQPGRGYFLPRPYPTWSVVLGFDRSTVQGSVKAGNKPRCTRRRLMSSRLVISLSARDRNDLATKKSVCSNCSRRVESTRS